MLASYAYAPRDAAADAPTIAAFAPCGWGSDDCNVCIPDVAGSFNRLRDHNDAMGFQMNGAPDVSEDDNHWQGVQRLMAGGGRYLAISRSILSENTDVSFAVVEMASRNNQGLRFRSNRLDPTYDIDTTAPPSQDRVVLTVPHENGFLHAGGIQLLGNVLAVPFEIPGEHSGPGPSMVVFFDLADPLHPKRLPYEVDHSFLSGNAGTATFGKLASGQYLLVIGRFNATVLDFYVSTGTDLRTTGYQWFYTWSNDQLLPGVDSNFSGYQALNFVAQCDGSLFMVGTDRTNGDVENQIGGGEDFVDLFSVANGTGGGVAIRKVGKKHVVCDTCQFDAAGGAYVDPQGQLYVYAAKKDNDGVAVSGDPTNCSGPACSTQFAEFRPVPHGTCGKIEDAWAEVYEDSGLSGRSLMVDFVDRALEDYSNFHNAENFEDIASSAGWCIPPRAAFRLWENKNPCGGSHLDLVGDGTYHTNVDFGDFGDKASCAEWIGGPFARAGADRSVECTGSTTPVQLDGQASISLTGQSLTYAWQAPGVSFDDSTSPTPTGGFPLGQTVATLTFSDSVGSDTASADVTVADTIAPTISCPADLLVDATSPAGAVVNYGAPTATDSCGVSSVACIQPSGSTLPVGTNTIQCMVSDFASHSASCTFTAHVNGPAEQATNLIATISGLENVSDGRKNSLIVKLRAALAALAAGDTPGSCGNLGALANEIQAQSGKGLTAAQAAELVADVARIEAALGC